MSNDNKVTRKLRAILSADVKGYSLLMTDDEVHTIQTLKAYRSLMLDLIQQHSGRVVDNPGDNLLAEFSSAVDAVDCAVDVQNKLKKENAKFVEDRRLQFRIGVNIGDVIHDGDRIYGSGVNVAARIEGIADAGGICISRNTYDQVKDKLDLGYDYLGEHEVKNIEEPVRVYRVLMGTESPKPLVEEELELPDKPSIAVLPFDNMSGDPDQEYFSDGLTEQIINGLCKVSNLFVIARNSSFAYKGKPVSVKQIAKELGVRYILEGSVQRAGDRVRITAQLIDATTDYHMWSENYDRDLEDIFVLQDEITLKLISVMEVNLVYGEQAKLWAGKGTTTGNIKAYDNFIRAWEGIILFTRAGFEQSIKHAKEAARLDPNYVLAYVSLGFAHLFSIMYGWSDSLLQSFEQAERYASKAMELNDKLDYSHLLLAQLNWMKRQDEDAIKEAETALALNPNGADAHAYLGAFYLLKGMPESSIRFTKIAMRLNPIPPGWYYLNLGSVYRCMGNYSMAIEAAAKSVKLSPNYINGHMLLATSYAALGDISNAKAIVSTILRINPIFSLDIAAMVSPYRKEEDLKRMLGLLRIAGIPEHSPE